MASLNNSSEEVQPRHCDVKLSEDTEISHVINELLDPSTRSKALQKYVSIGEHFYRNACDLDVKVRIFEQNIHRPYFHVKPLDNDQLQNWHRYLDFVEMEGDFDWIIKLYERCLISCANYPEFWMRYVDFVESKGGKEIAHDALERATKIFLKNAPEIHLFNAWHKEKEGDVEGVRTAFLHCNEESDYLFADIVRRKANMEKRLGNYVAASNIYKEAVEVAVEKRPQALPMLYVLFAHLVYMISTDVEATKGVLLDGIQHAPHSKLLIKELILFGLMHEGAVQVDVLDPVVERALTLASNVSSSPCTQDWEELSNLYIEFTDFCGSIHDVWRAWNRHVKLFPHLIRQQSSINKPTKAGGLWKTVTGGRAGGVDHHLQKSLKEHGENGSIQLPQQDEKLVTGERNEKSELAKYGATESTNQVDLADEREPAEFDKSREIQQVQEQVQSFQQERPSNETQNIGASHSPRMEAPKEMSLSNASVHEVDKMQPGSPQENNAAAKRYKGSSGPSQAQAEQSDKNALPAGPSDRDRGRDRQHGKDRLLSGSPTPRNSEERSVSPRRRGGSREYSHDRRYRERSVSPRRHGPPRRYSEDRWHRGERNDRRYYRHQDNPRGGGRRMQNQNQNQNLPNVCVPLAASQAQLPLQPSCFPQAQINQYTLPGSNVDPNQNVENNNQLYNQMWQYYYYTQQQQLLQQQQQQRQQQQQQQQPVQQQTQPTTTQLQNPQQQAQPVNSNLPQLILPYQQPFYQQQIAEQPQSHQQQLQSEPHHEAMNQQHQAYQYQELQKQNYFLYLQQLQLYQSSQQQAGSLQDQHSSQLQQKLPAQSDDQEKLPETQNGDDKLTPYQHDDGSRQISGHDLLGRGVESTHGSTSGAKPLAQSQDELPEIEGTDG